MGVRERSKPRRGRWANYVLPVLAIAALGPVRAAEPPTTPGDAQVLRSFPSAPSAFELTQGDCSSSARGDAGDGSRCAFEVNLVEGKKVLDRARLEGPGCGPASTTVASVALGVGHDAPAWGTSDEGCDIQVAAQPVELGGKTIALLVTELQGFEYRYRTHRLYLARDGKLTTPWEYTEDSGGTHWTTTAVLGAGEQDVAFVDLSRASSGVCEKLSATRLRVDRATGQVATQPLPDPLSPLYVLQVGRFPTAKTVPKERPHCLHELLVLRAALFPGLKLPPFFFGAVFARRGDADAALAAAKSCTDQNARVFEDKGRRGRPHAEHP